MAINIITRTSGRPNYFNDMYESVTQQEGDWELWVTSDDDNSLSYLDRPQIEKVIKVKKSKEGNCPWNDYLNKAIDEIGSGWIMILDDDDIFVDPKAVSIISDKLTSPKQVAFWRVQFPGTLIPNDNHWKKRPVAGQISMIGIAFHTDWVESMGKLFDVNCLGDFRLATKLYDRAEIVWIDETLTSINRPQTGGHGKRDDKDG